LKNNAAVVAIGSELLNGQITNRNGAWISQQLFTFGVNPLVHLIVDDNKAQIIQYLSAAVKECDHIFITGGLGPTSDDITRDAVAEWLGLELKYDEGSWEHVQNIYSNFNRPVPPSNKQQCYFPQHAVVLNNPAGTANAFYLNINEKHIWVLPGPPHEIEVIWTDHISQQLQDIHESSIHYCIRKWRTIGIGESNLTEVVEPIVSGSGAELAYRAHAPYVEIKIRYPLNKSEEFRALRVAMNTQLEPWIFEEDEENKSQELVDLLESRNSAWVYDSVTEGYLNELLSESLRKSKLREGSFSFVNSFENTEDPEEFMRECLGWTKDVDIALGVIGFYDSGEWTIGVKQNDDIVIKTFKSPYQRETLRRRNQHAIAALAIREWLAVLKDQLRH